MNLGQAVFRMIAGRHARHREESPQTMVRRALGEAGGVSQLARSIGVARTTVQRWNRGATPTLESQELLRAVLRRADLREARAARITTRNDLTVRGRQDGRERTVRLGRYLEPGTMGRAVEAYLRGATAADLHVIVWSGITDRAYRWMFQPPGGFAQMSPSERLRATHRAEGRGGGDDTGGGPFGAPGRSGGAGGAPGGDEGDEDGFFEDEAEDLEEYFDDDLVGDFGDEYDVPELEPGYGFSVSGAG